MPDVCPEKLRLMTEYNQTTNEYSLAVSVQLEKMGIVPKLEYRKVQQATEKARHISADARDKLERHIAQHGC